MPFRVVSASTEGMLSVTNPKRQKGAKPKSSTVVKLNEAVKMITDGKSKETVIRHFMEKYGLSRDQSYKYWCCGCKLLIPKDIDEYKKSMIQANIDRLEKIIEQGMSSGNLKVAKEAIAELNKMFGINGGTQVSVKQDADSNTQEITIKFGE